jgi:hypothetical protein
MALTICLYHISAPPALAWPPTCRRSSLYHFIKPKFVSYQALQIPYSFFAIPFHTLLGLNTDRLAVHIKHLKRQVLYFIEYNEHTSIVRT